jgi:hypothetical protein
VDCAQGFFFGRPKPLEDVLAVELREEAAADPAPVPEKDPAAA